MLQPVCGCWWGSYASNFQLDWNSQVDKWCLRRDRFNCGSPYRVALSARFGIRMGRRKHQSADYARNFWISIRLVAATSLPHRLPAVNGSEVRFNERTKKKINDDGSCECEMSGAFVNTSKNSHFSPPFYDLTMLLTTKPTSRIFQPMNHVADCINEAFKVAEKRIPRQCHRWNAKNVICHRREVVAPAWLSGLIKGSALSCVIRSTHRQFEVSHKRTKKTVHEE